MLLGGAALGEDEILDAEEVTLHQKELAFVPAFADGRDRFQSFFVMPSPQCGGNRRGRLAVIVERDLGLDTKRGRRGNRVADDEPEAVEVIEPQSKIRDVRLGYLLQACQQGVPQHVVLRLGLGIVLRRTNGRGLRKECGW